MSGRLPWVCALLLAAVGCSSSGQKRPADPDLVRFADSARVSFNHGSFEQAVHLYRRALERARAMDDALEMGNNAYNLAVALLALGRPEEAMACLAEARMEFERLRRDPLEIVLLEAAAARMAGRTDQAWKLMTEVDGLMRGGTPPALRLQAILLNAQLMLDRDDLSAARAVLEAMPGDARKVRVPMLRARRAGLQARIAERQGNAAEAAGFFDEEAEEYRKAGRRRELALALGRAGSAYQAAGDASRAADRFYRAARSLAAQGDDRQALELIQRALPAAEAAGPKAPLKPLADLFEEIRGRVERQAGAQAAEAPKGVE